MTGQLKQRIVGGIVLLFLAMIILPWLFTNNQSSLVPQKNSRKKEKLATNDFPEMLDEAPQMVKPIADKIDTPESAPIVNPSSPAKKIDDNSERIMQVNPTKISNIENSIVHTAPDTEPPPVPIIHQKAKAKSSPPKEFKTPDFEKVKTPVIAELTKVKKQAKSLEKNWAVQLGSFTNKANAAKLVQQLKTKGYITYVKTTKSANNVITKVFVGLEAERHSAEIMMMKIEKSLDIHGVIVKMNP
ncbi:MAG: SPOR domain-containing protein [Gammaproteobacteria bacterium]|nr:SPOR domain-containing protein [Gammaproteobacteria bacterium]